MLLPIILLLFCLLALGLFCYKNVQSYLRRRASQKRRAVFRDRVQRDLLIWITWLPFKVPGSRKRAVSCRKPFHRPPWTRAKQTIFSYISHMNASCKNGRGSSTPTSTKSPVALCIPRRRATFRCELQARIPTDEATSKRFRLHITSAEPRPMLSSLKMSSQK